MKKKPSWTPNTEKSWKVLDKKSQGLLVYLNRTWDLNLEKQNLQLNLNLCSQIHKIWGEMRCYLKAMYFQFAELAYPIRMSFTIYFTMKESQKNKLVKEDGLNNLSIL